MGKGPTQPALPWRQRLCGGHATPDAMGQSKLRVRLHAMLQLTIARVTQHSAYKSRSAWDSHRAFDLNARADRAAAQPTCPSPPIPCLSRLWQRACSLDVSADFRWVWTIRLVDGGPHARRHVRAHRDAGGVARRVTRRHASRRASRVARCDEGPRAGQPGSCRARCRAGRMAGHAARAAQVAGTWPRQVAAQVTIWVRHGATCASARTRHYGTGGLNDGLRRRTAAGRTVCGPPGMPAQPAPP